MTYEWVAVLIYLLLQLALGAWVSKRISSETDYFLAGRSLGFGLASFSIFATWFGAETCMGSSAAIFEEGLAGSRADPFGYSLCLFFMGLFLARQLWKRQITTLADLYRSRFGVNIERLAVMILVPSSLIWAAAQIRAFGQLVSVVTPFNVEVGVMLAAAFVVAYTFLGGLLGDVITDFVQGIVLIVGLLLVLGAAFFELGGFGSAISAVDTSRLSFTVEGESLLARMDSWMIPILGSLVAQELLSRVLACRSSRVAWQSSFAACSIYLTVGLIPVVLGLLGPQFALDLQDSEQFLPVLARSLLPEILYIVFIGALISAILSTVDSTLLTISALISHNLFGSFVKNQNEAQKVKMARLFVVISGIAGFVLAFYAEGIYALVEMASSFGTAGVLVITLLGLYTKWGNSLAAGMALISGLVSTPLYEYVLELEAPFMSSILTSLLTYVLAASLLEKVPSLAWSDVK